MIYHLCLRRLLRKPRSAFRADALALKESLQITSLDPCKRRYDDSVFGRSRASLARSDRPIAAVVDGAADISERANRAAVANKAAPQAEVMRRVLLWDDGGFLAGYLVGQAATPQGLRRLVTKS